MNPLYQAAVDAAVKAGEEILDIYGEGEFLVELKADESPLTIADKKAHEIICSILRETGLPVLSEEGRDIVYEERKKWKSFWLVDPLDGTKEFIRRNGEFTVNIALIEEGRSTFGVVLAPAISELYLGIPGWGSFLCTHPKNYSQPVEYLVQFADRLPVVTEDTYYRIVASRSHFNIDTENFIHSVDTGGKEIRLVSKGSSLKLCMVASGEADIYPRLGPTMEWDVAAACAVVAGAGKRVLRLDDNRELEFNKRELLNPYFVVR